MHSEPFTDRRYIHPDTITAISRWHPSPNRAIRAAAERAKTACEQWGVQPAGGLLGGAKSVVFLGDVTVPQQSPLAPLRRVVVKAPLDPREATREQVALRMLAGSPHIAATAGSVLALEYVDGGFPVSPCSTESGAAAATMLTSLHRHGRWHTEPTGLPLFADEHHPLFGGYADRLRRNSSVEGGAELVAAAEGVLPSLLAEPHVVCHGDLQLKNILLSGRGRKWCPIDPTGVLAPAGWDAALLACSVASVGDVPPALVEAAQVVAGEQFAGWVTVAAVALSGTTLTVRDGVTFPRITAFLRSR